MKAKNFLISFCVVLCLFNFILSIIVSKEGHYKPSCVKVNLIPILTKVHLEEADYKLIYEQTGLAKPIITELQALPDFKNKIIKFQNNYFSVPHIRVDSLNPFTSQEIIQNSEGHAVNGFELAPYKNGYIFLTKSTYTLNWRHGHAGVVIDDKRGKTLEAMSLGTISSEQDAARWRYYPSFKMMRLKDVPQPLLDQIAAYASSALRNMSYDIFADKNQSLSPQVTHCSLLVWQAFKPFGFDLDATGGLLVSPQNIAESPLLETLQVFGFNPDKDW